MVRSNDVGIFRVETKSYQNRLKNMSSVEPFILFRNSKAFFLLCNILSLDLDWCVYWID